MNIKNRDLASASSFLSNLKINSSIETKTIINMVTLTSKIKELFNNYTEAFKLLMGSYNVIPNDFGNYDWSANEKVEEVTIKNDELSNTENEIGVDFSYDPELYVKFADGLSVGELTFLKELLS